MGLSFKTAAGLLLLVQFFHLASFQHSTNPPAVTIDRSWLRELVRNGSASLNRALAQNGLEYDERGQSPDKSSGGIASGGMTIYSEEDENLTAEGSGDEGNMLTAVPVDVTVAAFEPPESNMSLASNVTDGASESNRVNITDTTEFPDNPTTPTTTPRNDSSDLSAQNVTSTEDLGNHTDSTTALPPQENVTNETTPTVAKDWNSRIDSASTVSDIPEVTMVEFNKTVDQTDTPVTPTTSLKALTAVEVNTPEGTNKTGKVAAEGSSSDRGLDSDATKAKKSYWAAVLGTMVAVVIVVTVTYVVLKRKYQRDYSHRKLIEDYPSEPVLRLDNCEPLDLNFGQMAYYNPGLQGDNIQMSNIPQRR